MLFELLINSVYFKKPIELMEKKGLKNRPAYMSGINSFDLNGVINRVLKNFIH